MVNAIASNEIDTVVTVTKNIYAGEDVIYILNGKTTIIKAISDIPVNHKVAVTDVVKGKAIYKYGEKIGCAIDNICTGEHVHTNNLE